MNFENDILKASDAKPVVVQLSASWCHPCKAMKSVFNGILAQRSDFDYIVVDVEDDPSIATMFGVRSVPTIYLFKNQSLVSKAPNVPSAKVVSDWLNQNI